MAGLSTLSSSEGEGGSGEFSFRGGSGGTRELSIFVLEPDDLTRLRLGAVNGGLSSALFLVVNVLLWPTQRKLRFSLCMFT